MHKRFALIAATLFQPTLSVAETHDNFQHLGEINKASIVMLAEEGLVPASLAAKITAGIGRVIAEQNEDGAARSSNYLDFEARLVEVAGPDASRLHTGRSRQDIGSTFRRMALREATLDTYESRLGARQALLGFDAPVENSYDANLVSSVDSKIEFTNALSTSAITVGQLMQNLHTQKRNPRPLDAVRLLATAVVSSAHTVTLNPHNTNSGMNDYRPGTQAQDAANKAQAMYVSYVDVMNNLIVNRERALQEVEIDYSTMTEVADVLLRHADVPFRTGHHYASELTTFGRANGKRPKDLTNDELLHIYKESVGEELPVEIELIRQAMDPAAMVRERKGLGGPQEAEVLRMLARHNDSLASGRAWLDASRSHLQNSTAALEQAFAELEQ